MAHKLSLNFEITLLWFVPLENCWVISGWAYLAGGGTDLLSGRKRGAHESSSPRATLVQCCPSFPHPNWFHSTLCGVKVGHSWNLITYQPLSQDKMPDLMAFVLSKKLLQGSGSSRSSQSREATSLPFIFELQLEWQTQKMPWLRVWKASKECTAQEKHVIIMAGLHKNWKKPHCRIQSVCCVNHKLPWAEKKKKE